MATDGVPSWVVPRVAELLHVTPDGCWLWLGERSSKGYGIAVRHRRRVRVHRWVYAMSGRPIPDGHDLDHRCRVRACANPDHLIPRDHGSHGVLSAAARTNLEAWEDGGRW